MDYTYWLPDADGHKKDFRTNNNSVLIIGANGSGKSKLGAWIEQQNFDSVHRIGAQRSLNFRENITQRSLSQAEDFFFYGTDNHFQKESKGVRWGGNNSYTTKLIDDYDNVLSALIALNNFEYKKYFDRCREAERHGIDKPCVPEPVIDRLISVWDDIFPQRRIVCEDSRFYAILQKNDGEIKYSANQMSDGERTVLYMTAQVFCVPPNKILLVDEPEVHLHRSLMNRLWTALEQMRPDCLFIYITHDTQFASLHGNSDKFWIKEYDGKNWTLEKIDSTDLPKELLLDILGNRKAVLFVEGEKNSYDTQLYMQLYPNYYVVACGGCSQVIARTKAFKNSSAIHHCEVFGIIDRDYRSDHEIDAYWQDNIYVLNVAEVENLFLVEELIKLIAGHMAKDPDEVFEDVKNYVVKQRFENQIEKQICQSVEAQLKYKLNTADISKKSEDEAKAALSALFNTLSYDHIKTEQETKFRLALESGDYAAVIKVFNEKSLSKSIGHYMGINNGEYCDLVLALLRGEKREQIISAIASYLPMEIPR